MQIGQTIRQYRKQKDLTQEEMANRLGVTAPAVNKWENGNSMPDITLLAPIARLLGISLDTLLSFREDLTQEEIQDIVYTVNSMLREKPFEEAFAWAKEKIEQYPNCEALSLEMAVLLNAELLKKGNAEGYESTIHKWFTGALRSEHEQIRTMAVDGLFSSYLSKRQYDKAEESLKYLSDQNPEKKRRQALIYSRTGRKEEAYKGYEELLFSMYQMANLLLGSIGTMAAEEQNMNRLRMIVDKQSALAKVFEMGEYYEVSCKLELATLEHNAEQTIDIMQRMLASLEDMNHFTKSPLYEHMAFSKIREEYVEQIREDLLNCFRDEKTFGFLKGDSRWENLK